MQHDAFVMREVVKAYLREVRLGQMRMRDLQDRMLTLRESMEGLRSPGASSGGGPSDRMAEGMARLQKLEDEWSEAAVSYAAFAAEAYDLCFGHGVNRWAVWLHDVDGLTWEAVGRRVGYSEKNARRIAESGYRELYYIVPEEYRRSAFPNAAPL